MATSLFQHSRLDTSNPRAFRVLELLPSHNLNGDIRCELHHRTLNESIRYEALSYAWGEPNPQVNITINGSSVLGVTKNCYEALCHLRRRFRRRVLWVDAICIDQQDNEENSRERNHQVKFMSEIYAKAVRVLVWLGCAEPGTMWMVTRLRLLGMTLGAAIRLKPPSGPAWRGYCETNLVDTVPPERNPSPQLMARVKLSILQNLAKFLLDGMMSGPRHQALASMLRSSWWERLWTLQEHVFGRHCEAYLGRQRINFTFLEYMNMQLYRSTPTWLPHPLPNYVARVQIGAFSKWMMEVLETHDAVDEVTFQDQLQFARDRVAQTLFVTAFWFDTKRPIDKIYGLYTFLDLCFPFPLPEVDYNKTAAEVFEETIWAWIQSRSDLSILKLAGRPESVDELHVPSWVPAWHKNHPRFVNAVGLPTDMLQMDLQRLFLDMPFSWVYTDRSEMRVAARNEAQRLGPVARQISPGRLQILRVRCVGRVAYAFGPYHADHSFHPIPVLCHQVCWCWVVHSMYPSEDCEAAISELFRSIYIPGIHSYDSFPPDTTADQYEAFRTWFGLMVYCKYHKLQSSELADPVANSDTVIPESHLTTNSLQQVARLNLDVWLASDEETARAIIETRCSGTPEERGDLVTITRQIRKLKGTLTLMRNYALCVLDNDRMLAVANYWCREGDEVFVFPGADTPFLVRRDLKGECYRLVGPVLVDRLRMIGYQKWRADGDDLRDIILI